ncbi:glycosyltransferase family 4 protein [Deinococcus deserti]|uniref:Putative Lipopolysaccharide biosynthesis protein (Glycosyltransferase) n=1 Tax=Deinococcus deserti (strain DSM 17065 / CIP 109153 / LMG 22923 / VCD115) TaxID=546414 RepID=C1CYS2_DEIDV|nr:glycosyltransferase family 4 protein [Deinococcus deserti]ACO47102.1 putative Lipopolysaccharide biosynthesis protein (glycosyltransferase) [Deinococcus deserti VCD115]
MTSSASTRVLFVTDAPAVGGSEVYMREIIPPMRPFGVQAEVAMPAAAGTADFRAQLSERGISVHAYHDLQEVVTVERAGTFDLTVLSSWNALGYRKYYLALRGPFVSLVHDQLMLHIPGLPQALYRAFYEVLQARDIRGAQHVVTVSHWAAAYLRRHHRMSQVHAVPNGVDVHKFRPASETERQTLREVYGFRRFTVLVPARMSIEKNHPAVMAVARAAPELDFVLVGTGYLEGVLRRVATPNVRFFGKRHDMPELYRAADVVLQPTIAENQSLATLEALSSGTPVVTNDIPAQRELMTFGQEGLLVGSGVHGYATALRALAAHPEHRRCMGESARSRVLAGHTLEQNAATLAGLLRELSARP